MQTFCVQITQKKLLKVKLALSKAKGTDIYEKNDKCDINSLDDIDTYGHRMWC